MLLAHVQDGDAVVDERINRGVLGELHDPCIQLVRNQAK